MGSLFANIIFSAIGVMCLMIWHRDWATVERERDEKYAGSFAAAGRVMILNFIAALGAAAMIGFIISALFMWIYRAFTNHV